MWIIKVWGLYHWSSLSILINVDITAVYYIIRVCVSLSPGMARPQVADEGTASDMEGNYE